MTTSSHVDKINNSNFEEVKTYLSGSSSTDVTGGMKAKIEELADLSRLGIVSYIINGSKPGKIRSALLNEDAGGSVIRI